MGTFAIIMKLSPQYVITKSTISDHDVVLLPGLLLIFLHGCEIKSGWGLGRGYIENMGGRELPVCTLRTWEVENCLIVY